MLCLSRKIGEKIVIGGQITVQVIGVEGSKIRLGITAPDWVEILREELLPALREESQNQRRLMGNPLTKAV